MNSGDSSKGDGTHPEKKPDYFVRMVPGFIPGQADVAKAYLQYLPESLKTEYILALAELNSLDSRSITADAKTAMIASLHCAQNLDELAIALCRVERLLVRIEKQNQTFEAAAAKVVFNSSCPPPVQPEIDNEAISKVLAADVATRDSKFIDKLEEIQRIQVICNHDTTRAEGRLIATQQCLHAKAKWDKCRDCLVILLLLLVLLLQLYRTIA